MIFLSFPRVKKFRPSFFLYSFPLSPFPYFSFLFTSLYLTSVLSSFPQLPHTPPAPPERPIVFAFLLTAVQNVSEEVVKVHNDCICLL